MGGPSLNLDALVLAVREAQRGPERLVLLRQALNSPDNPVFGEVSERGATLFFFFPSLFFSLQQNSCLNCPM